MHRHRTQITRQGVAAFIAVFAAACGAPQPAPVGGGQGSSAPAASIAPSAAATTTPSSPAASAATVPTGFSGTFSGHNTTSWSGTVTFHRVQPGTPAADCEQSPDQVLYCYETTGGSVTWVTKTGTGTFGLTQPDGSGSVVLIVSDSGHPDHAGTYELGVSPAFGLYVGTSSAQDLARAWLSAVKYPKYAGDFHLAGAEDTSGPCGYEGCGPVTTWTWDLQPTLGP